MDYHYLKDKLNRFYARYIGGQQRPTFFDIQAVYPELNVVTEHIQVIQDAFQQVLTRVDALPRYHDVDPGETDISNHCDKKWNVFMFYLLGQELPEARKLCPQICDLVQRVPNMIQAFFSILEPGKSIPLHEGPYMGYLRYHLGVHVPKNNPPQIIVNQQPYVWKEGEAVLFDDSWPHEVRNESDDYRAVLIIDVLRPMPFLPRKLNQFVTNVIARYFYGRRVIKRTSEFLQIKPLFQ